MNIYSRCVKTALVKDKRNLHKDSDNFLLYKWNFNVPLGGDFSIEIQYSYSVSQLHAPCVILGNFSFWKNKIKEILFQIETKIKIKHYIVLELRVLNRKQSVSYFSRSQLNGRYPPYSFSDQAPPLNGFTFFLQCC